MPIGGTAGQVLTKTTATSYDTSWTTPISQAQWTELVGRVAALEALAGTDPELRTYVQQIMSVLDPGAPPAP